jgi:signal transduction histidine kinase
MPVSDAQARPDQQSHSDQSPPDRAPGPAALVRVIVNAIGWFTRTSRSSAAAMIALMMAMGWLVTYLGGGTRALPPHWLYLPIFLAAIRFGLKGATATALVATVVAGPLLPGDVTSRIHQSIGGWTYRGLWFVVIGVLMAAIIVQLEEALSKEAQLARREAELAAHQAAVLATVSHEFRSPLSVLLGTASMLSDVKWSGLEADVVEGITSAARRLDDLVAAVLAVSEGPQAIEQKVKEVRLREVCLGVRGSLEYGMRGRLRIDVPDVVMQTKPAVLQGLLRQLVSNALKFSPEQTTIDIEAWASQGDRACIAVSDRGPGVSEGFLPRAFDAFTQEDESITRAAGGLGIGLFVARRLAECIDADVELRPRTGGGMTAVVTMPGDVLPPHSGSHLRDRKDGTLAPQSVRESRTAGLG